MSVASATASSLPDFSGHTAAGAIEALEGLGWTRIATGDWSWVLASPDGTRAARVTPWDAAYRLHAELCRTAPSRYLQRVDAILPLGALGHVVVMERLFPAPADAAARLCASIGLRGDSGWQPPDGIDLGGLDADPDIVALRSQLAAAAARGAATLPFWGGYDIRPANVMADAAGGLKLVDPFFIAGPKIIAAIVARDRAALQRLPEGALAAFFSIPPFASGAGELGEAAAEMGLLGGVAATAAGS